MNRYVTRCLNCKQSYYVDEEDKHICFPTAPRAAEVGSALGGANVESIPEYFAKPNIVEGLVAAHPVLLVRQMANEILRLRSSRPAIIEECARVCDELYSDTAWHPYYRQAANNCAETIRAKIHQWRDIKVVGKDAIRVLAPREQNAATQAGQENTAAPKPLPR